MKKVFIDSDLAYRIWRLGSIERAARLIGARKAWIKKWIADGVMPKGACAIRLAKISGIPVEWLTEQPTEYEKMLERKFGPRTFYLSVP